MCTVEFQTIKALESTRHFIVEEYSAEQFRCLALELPENIGEQKYVEIERWASGNAMTIREERNWPKSVLEYISKSLESGTVFPVDFLFATAFSVDADGISVCSASDMRVHVIKDNQLKFYTRDHVAKFEDPEKVPPIEGQEGFEPFFTLSTRSLGLGSVNPPEEWKWQIALPKLIMILHNM